MEYQNITKVSIKIQNKIIQWQLQMRMIKKKPKERNIERYISPEKGKKIIDNLIFNIIV